MLFGCVQEHQRLLRREQRALLFDAVDRITARFSPLGAFFFLAAGFLVALAGFGATGAPVSAMSAAVAVVLVSVVIIRFLFLRGRRAPGGKRKGNAA
jgi:hypothetical protein